MGGQGGGSYGASASSSSSATSGIQFGNNQMGDNSGGGGKSLPMIILGGVAIAMLGVFAFILTRRKG